MTKIVYRPDPPTDPSATHRIKNTSLIQNREVSARLFEQSLVKAEAQRRSEIKTHDRSSDRQAQIEKSAVVESAVDTEQVLRGVLSVRPEEVEIVETTVTDSLPEDDTEKKSLSDQQETQFDSSALLFSPDIPYQFDRPLHETFGSRDQHENSSPQSGEFVKPGMDLHQVNSAGTECSQLIDLAELDQFIEASDGLTDFNDWSFTFDDGPIAELKLSYKENQGWNIRVLSTSQDADVIDSQLLESLHHRLELAGLAVSEVGYFEAICDEP